MSSSRFDIKIDVFLFDPERRSKAIGRQFAARDEPPHLLLAQPQTPSGLFNGEKVRFLELPAVGGGAGHRLDPHLLVREPRAAGPFSGPVSSRTIRSSPMSEAMTSRAACRASRCASSINALEAGVTALVDDSDLVGRMGTV